MASRNFIASALEGAGEQTTDPYPTYLTITPNAIRLGHGSEVFPIRNITRIGKYKVLEAKFPLVLIGALALGGLSALAALPSMGLIVGTAMLAGAGYGVWQRMRPKTFAFGFETTAGSVRYLYVKDESFVTQVLDTVTKYIETEQTASMVINVEDRSIKNYGFLGTAVTGNS